MTIDELFGRRLYYAKGKGLASMVSYQKIEKEYIRIASKWGEVEDSFPIPRTRDDFGGYHLEIAEDGKMSLIAIERGNINDRKETDSVDELLYWVFKMRAKAKALKYETEHRIPNQDFRRVYFHQSVVEVNKLSNKWSERMVKELNDILKENPFMDDLPNSFIEL